MGWVVSMGLLPRVRHGGQSLGRQVKVRFVAVDPDGPPTGPLGRDQRGAASTEGIEDQVVLVAEELDQPARQLLREGARMANALGALAGELPEAERPGHELLGADRRDPLAGPLALPTGEH